MGRSINDPNIVKVCAGESTSTMLVSYNTNTTKNIFFRIGFTGELTSETLTSVTSYQMWVNDTLVTPLSFPFTVNQNDRVHMSITRSATGVAASVKFDVKGIGSSVVYTQNAKETYPRYMLHKENVIAFNDYLLNSDQSILGQGSTASFFTNCVWGDPIKGKFDFIYEPALWNFTGQHCFGLNNLSTAYNVIPRYNRMIHCIMLDANAVKIYELGVLKTTLGLTYNQMRTWRINSKETFAGSGVYEVSYWDSTDNGASWTLDYISTISHNGSVDFYPDWMTQGGYYLRHHPPKLTY